MRSRRLVIVGLAAVLAATTVSTARAGEPVVGMDVGAAIPISTFRNTANPGGVISPFVGYQFGEKFAFTPLLQPMYAIFDTNNDLVDQENAFTTIFAITAGGRFSLFDENKEVYLGAQGGYYTDVLGPINDDGGGFNISSGFNYEFRRGTALGAYVRYDESSMRAKRGSNDNLKFLATGLGLRHRFLPPLPVAVAAAPAPPAPPAPAPAKKKIVLRGVNFDFDKAMIRSDAEPILDEAARTLSEEGAISIVVEGHTDSIGTEPYNQSLSVRRAEAVRAYLAGKGIEASRMSVEGLGETTPVASNDTSSGRAQNRRVELRVLP